MKEEIQDTTIEDPPFNPPFLTDDDDLPPFLTDEEREARIEVKDGRKWHFTMIENKVFEDERLSGPDLLVYWTLCYHASRRGRDCFPSLTKIREESRCSKQGVVNSINHLIELKYIEKEKRRSPDGMRFLNNRYTILDLGGVVHESPMDGEGSPYEFQGVVHESPDNKNHIKLDKRIATSSRSSDETLNGKNLVDEINAWILKTDGFYLPIDQQSLTKQQWGFSKDIAVKIGRKDFVFDVLNYLHYDGVLEQGFLTKLAVSKVDEAVENIVLEARIAAQ